MNTRKKEIEEASAPSENATAGIPSKGEEPRTFEDVQKEVHGLEREPVKES